MLNIALAYDRETERRAGLDKVTNATSLSVAVGYSVTERLVVGTGFGHGFLNDDTPDGSWKWTKLGESEFEHSVVEHQRADHEDIDVLEPLTHLVEMVAAAARIDVQVVIIELRPA